MLPTDPATRTKLTKVVSRPVNGFRVFVVFCVVLAACAAADDVSPSPESVESNEVDSNGGRFKSCCQGESS